MAKGYWIPHIDVSDPEGYKAYMAATPAAHDKYRGHALVRGGAQQVVEGRSRSRNVLREFPDYATALACYRSAEYQRAKPLRLPHSVCDFVIIEGYIDGDDRQYAVTDPLRGRVMSGGRVAMSMRVSITQSDTVDVALFHTKYGCEYGRSRHFYAGDYKADSDEILQLDQIVRVTI